MELRLQKLTALGINEIEYVSRNNSMRPPTAPLKFLNHVSEKNTDIIQEYFIPINNFIEFIDGVRRIVVEDQINLMGMTIRYIPKNYDVFLSYWKKEAFSDGCSTEKRSWYQILKSNIENKLKKNKEEKAQKLYLKALDKFEKAYAKDKKNSDLLNYFGFALRKTGDFEKAEKFYLEGLKIDAAHLGINEYLGELYVQTNRIELAKERLQVLNGCKCEEYEELKELIEKN